MKPQGNEIFYGEESSSDKITIIREKLKTLANKNKEERNEVNSLREKIQKLGRKK